MTETAAVDIVVVAERKAVAVAVAVAVADRMDRKGAVQSCVAAGQVVAGHNVENTLAWWLPLQKAGLHEIGRTQGKLQLAGSQACDDRREAGFLMQVNVLLRGSDLALRRGTMLRMTVE
jgi:hypothetical protein